MVEAHPQQSEPRDSDITRALEDLRQSVPRAEERLLELVYRELKRLAAIKMRGQAEDHTLQPTALVHEAWLRLIGSPAQQPRFRDRVHFFSAAATAMRTILVDHARKKHAKKRSEGALRVTLHPDLLEELVPLERILAVHELLDRFAQEHPRAARVVELLFFGGLGVDEAAAVLEISDRTVKRDWRFARAWLLQSLGES